MRVGMIKVDKEKVDIVVQVNGVVTKTLKDVDKDVNENMVVKEAMLSQEVLDEIGNREIIKCIYIPNKIMNIVVSNATEDFQRLYTTIDVDKEQLDKWGIDYDNQNDDDWKKLPDGLRKSMFRALKEQANVITKFDVKYVDVEFYEDDDGEMKSRPCEGKYFLCLRGFNKDVVSDGADE